MGRLRWVLWVVCVFVAFAASSATTARGGDLSVIRVCVRPPNLAADLAAWAYTPSGAGIPIDPKDFKKRYPNVTVYLFDPKAPADSPKLLPIPYNKLQCPAPPPPVALPPPPPKEDPAKTGDKKPAAMGGGSVSPEPKNDKKKNKAEDEEPPDLPKRLTRPPPAEWHPTPPKGGVTENWPRTVLPIRKAAPSVLPSVESGHGVLPLMGVGGRPGVLPFAGRPRPPPSEPAPAAGATAKTGGASGDSAKKGEGVTKTPFEKFAQEMAYAGAVANQQFGETDKHPTGSRYGIPGGKNANGPKSAVAQAAAGTTLVVIGIVGAGGLDKKLLDALKKKAPLILKGGGKVAEEAAEKFVDATIAKHGDAGRHIVADALNKNGAIGEYSVMKKFTDKLGGQMQAHHILEQKFVKKFGMGDSDRIPAVLLTNAQHKTITAELKAATGEANSLEKLWEGYQKAYADHPEWLKAIKPYFVKPK